MNKKTISIILLALFLITILFTVANVFLDDANTEVNQTGTLTIANRRVNYEKAGKCRKQAENFIKVLDNSGLFPYTYACKLPEMFASLLLFPTFHNQGPGSDFGPAVMPPCASPALARGRQKATQGSGLLLRSG